MKKFLIFLIVISGILFTGCSKARDTKYIRSYKISLTPDKELAKDYCYNYQGVITINQDYILGELQNDKKPTVYIDGRFYKKTNEIAVNFGDYNKTVGVLAGSLTNEKGSGTWESINCYGKWKAVRDD